jgi:hypothetical protein
MMRWQGAGRGNGRWGRALSRCLSREFLEGIEGGVQVAVAMLTAPVARYWYNRWGATSAETVGVMPGDELIPLPKMTSTRAVTIDAPPAEVWAWLTQIGQGRGGFYSFDGLECTHSRQTAASASDLVTTRPRAPYSCSSPNISIRMD